MVREANKYGPRIADKHDAPARKLSRPLLDPSQCGSYLKQKGGKKRKTFGNGLSEVAYRKYATEVVAVVAFVPQDADVRGEA